ncbi:DUF5658 family protein [Denitrobaculum tricleocarpae]|uniref:DUF5658 domain-containing protein n=1 Tax=Denitrobaculum tricleocarpae TaxID=2591009 RepID=A0A545TT62_9PROT|nr:DUF5658 family protein [Denitrobaculum tricleocarpae]TQV80403.1 hypothetical protein FKG95_09465 [Denitrobaculum tricleocarpae]
MFKWLPGIAAKNRNSPRLMAASYFIATCLITLAVLDIVTTNLGLAVGAYEANRIIRWFQSTMGDWWFLPRLIGQLIPAMMIVWYPHRLVLLVISPVVPILGFYVWNNARIVGMLS